MCAMKAFISYNNNQKEEAGAIGKFLKSIGIESFIAYNDIRTGSDWKNVITSELGKCDIFIPLLSKDFKSSDWCSQEVGVAYIKKMKIIPLSVDGTKPYGFINHIQTKSIKKMDIDISVAEGLMETMNNASGFAKLLKDVGTYKWAEKIYSVLEPYFSKFNKKDLKLIIENSLKNDQVYDSGLFSGRLFTKLLKLRKDDINKDEDLLELIETYKKTKK